MKNLLKNKFFYIVVGALLLVIFLLQNNRLVPIDFFFFHLAEANLLALLLVFFTLGAVAGFFGGEYARYKKNTAKRMKERAKKTRNTRDNFPPGAPSPPLH